MSFFRRSLLICSLLAVAASGSIAPTTAHAGTGPVRSRPAWDAPHVRGQLLVKLPPAAQAARVRGGLDILREIPALGLALVRAPAGRALPEAADELERAGVEWAEPNYTFELDLVPNDPEYLPEQAENLDVIDARAAWDYGTGRADIVIAVLDTGIDLNHEDLNKGIWTNRGEVPNNKIDDEGNGFVDDVHGWNFPAHNNTLFDDHGHGTHVAGIAAARINNGVGVAGLAGGATIMPLDVFGGGIGTYEDLIRAIVYAADNGAHVINMSLGASSYSLGEEAAVDYAYQRGVVVVAAAGNTYGEQRRYPAAHVHAIAVASTTALDELSIFSTRGDWVDVAAPGSRIYSTFPGNTYGSLSGTSMATPHVSGLAALILSRNPALTPDAVRGIIEGTSKDLKPEGRDIYFGAGRIDAGRAVAAVTPGASAPRGPAPGRRLDMDLPGCVEVLENGGFEDGLAAWQTQGAVQTDTARFYEGKQSAYFPGGPSARGVLTQTLSFPADAGAAVVRFVYRIDPTSYAAGSSPDWPFEDWFTVDWRALDGQNLGQLLRTGNTADTSDQGLQWDEYIYRLTREDVEALRGQGEFALVFTSQNDESAYMNVWVDDARVCVLSLPVRVHLPMVISAY